jgi:alpha-galactosidase
MRLTTLLAAAILLGPIARAQSPSADLALTPPMGWNSWNHFARKVTEDDVKAAADALVATGMRDAGYLYVNIDDTWEGDRDASGMLHANSKFPDMKGLADYVHARGLKLGIYSSPGPLTCAKFAGSLGHEQQDADLYASWGVDYLKYDLCSFRDNMKATLAAHPAVTGQPRADYALMRDAYARMRQALDKTGRPIVLSLCQYGVDDTWKWAPALGGNLWRTTNDIKDNYDRMSIIGFSQAGLAPYAGPGHWNDPDMLEVGNGGMNHDEYITHMSLWVLLAAPLLAGNDLSKMSDDAKSILMNKGAIAIDQDPLGKQGDRLRAVGPDEVWTKPLAHNSLAVGLFNRGIYPIDMTVTLAELGMTKAHTITDIWSGETLHPKSGVLTVTVPAHGAVLLRLE